MELKKLEALGLTPVEAKVYVALLGLGPSGAGEISRKAELNRTTTYYSLERLASKGLAGFSQSGGKRVFSAVPPKRLLEWLEEKKDAAMDVLPLLDAIGKTRSEPDVTVYRGKRGISAILAQITSTAGEYASFGAAGQFWEVMQHEFYAFQNRKRRLGIKSRVLIPRSSRAADAVKKSHASFRFLPDYLFTPSTTFVFGESVAIITWTGQPLAVVITDENISRAYLNYFNALWKTAKKP